MNDNLNNKKLHNQIKRLKDRIEDIESFLLDIPQYSNYQFPMSHDEEELYMEAEKVAREHQRVSASLLQRRLASLM
jgi:DNA segregation ATPase FtsK/SpoIIIE-like protein